MYEHVGPEVTSSQEGKVYKMAKRDYAWLMISRCSRSHSRQAKEQAQDLKSMITASNRNPYADLPDIGLPRVDGPPVMPEDPYAYVVAAFQSSPSPDYVPGPEYPPSPEFVLKPVYLEFMPLEDEILPAEEQPLPATVLPTTDSPGPEGAPANYPTTEENGDMWMVSSDDERMRMLILSGTEGCEDEVEADFLLCILHLHHLFTEVITTPLRDLLRTLPPRYYQPLTVSPPLPQISSPLLLVSMRAEAASTSHSLPLPPPIILSHTRPEGMPGAPVTDDTEMGRWMTEFTTRVRQDTDEIYTRDRRAHAHIARIMEAKARMSREAWGRTMDASDLARAEVSLLRYSGMVAQQASE
ncbi:hypothetical protein Tco_0213611 [Tanacetum coccineum]